MFKNKTLSIITIIFSLLITKFSYADPIFPGSKVMLIGDSLAVGLSSRFKLLAKEFGYKPVVDAKVGTTINQWSAVLEEKIKVAKPDLILVSLGTNDSGPWGKEFINNPVNLDKLLKIAKDNEVEVVWIGIPILPIKQLPYAPEISNMIQNKVEYYCDSHEFQFQRAADKIHFTPNGYNDWMDNIWSWMLDHSVIINTNEEEY